MGVYADVSVSCPACGNPLPEDVMCSISHTIVPGEKLCPTCGKKETLYPAWAEGRRRGRIMGEAAQKAMDGLGL